MAETGAKRSAAKRTTSSRSTSTRSAPSARAPKAAAEPACSVAFCPIGRAMSAADAAPEVFGHLMTAAPEVLGHLMNAARETLLAVTAVLEAKPGSEKHGPVGRASRLEKIDIG